jgi:hypothetical protein
LLVILLSVAVPFTATASIAAPMTSCPTPASSQVEATSTHDARDCCDPSDAQFGHHKPAPCKSGGECKSCSTVSLASNSVETPAFVAPASDGLTLTVEATPHRNPFGLWRPPRSV